MESDSAETIQRWWRKKLEDDRRVAEKTRQIAEDRSFAKVTLQNNALIARLAQLREEKAFESLKYERVLNMPAREVNEFMKSSTNMEKTHSSFERKYMERRHSAAKVIQRAFRKYYRLRMARKVLRSLTVIKPSKRVEYLDKINERLGNKRIIRAVPLEEIRSRLVEHKATRAKEAQLFAERRQLAKDMKRASISLTIASLEMLNSSSLSSLAVSKPLANYKAELFHFSQLKQIEENGFL